MDIWAAAEAVQQCYAGVGICSGVRACSEYFDFLDSTVAFCYTALPGSFIAEGSLFLSPHHQPSVLPNFKHSSLNLSLPSSSHKKTFLPFAFLFLIKQSCTRCEAGFISFSENNIIESHRCFSTI